MNSQFGRYRIENEEPDRGRVGRVYKAFDPNFNHYVAIKLLSAAPSPDLLQRLEDEGPAIVGLKHENIVQVYNVQQRDGVPYLVMEPLRGETLDPIVKSGKLAGDPVQLLDKVHILLQVAEGLQYAHSVNAIHGDIQPGNILVAPDKTVKILDFGIARIVDEGRVADKRTDIFAFAGLCYQLLTGTHPFAGDDLAASIDDGARANPPAIRSLDPDCPEALDTLILGLLAKDRELRPDSLEEAIPELQAILQHLRAERANCIAGSIPRTVEAGETESAPATLQVVLNLDPANEEGRIWRESLAAQQSAAAAQQAESPTGTGDAEGLGPEEPGAAALGGKDAAQPATTQSDTAKPDSELRASVPLEQLSAQACQAAAEPASPRGEVSVEQGAATVPAQERDVRQAAAPNEPRQDPAPFRIAPSAEERAQMALAKYFAKPIRRRRYRTMQWASVGGAICLVLVFVAWFLRPIRVAVTPTALEFHQECGRLAEAQQVELAVPDLAYDVDATAGWIRALPTSNGVRVSIAQSDLSPGWHAGTVRIVFRSTRVLDSRISIPVKLFVTIGADPSQLTFTYRRGGAVPGSQSVIVVGATHVTATTDAPWLRAAAGDAADNPTVRIWIEPSTLGAGAYRGEVRLKDATGSECRVTVGLTVSEAAATVDN